MRIKFFLTLLILCIWSSLAFASSGQVVFYPDGADYSQNVIEKISTDSDGAFVTLTLSGQAIPSSFTISSLTGGVLINDVAWSKSELSRSTAAKEVETKINQLKFKLAKLSAKKKAIEGGVSFWNGRSENREIKFSEFSKTSDLLISKLETLYAEQAVVDTDIAEVTDLIAELNRKMVSIDGDGRKVWKVRVSLTAGKANEAEFHIGYMLNNCGWTPKYKLDAYPEQKLIKFSFNAEIKQGSGIDFKDCEILLATVKKNSRISPPNLSLWVIKPEIERPLADRAAPAVMMEAAMVSPKNLSMSTRAVREVRATYSLWRLGRKNIPAGTERKFAVESQSWSSEFSFLSRPSITTDVFVLAKSIFEAAQDYPAGTGLIFMEGTMIGKQQFSFSGKEKEMFFGSDPMLKVERKTLDKQSGEKGMFGSSQTYSWKYRLVLNNSRKSEVKIHVEEPSPVARDKKIKLSSESKPEAKIEDNIFNWDVSVPGEGEAQIEYSVEMKAPDDMKLDLGLGK